MFRSHRMMKTSSVMCGGSEASSSARLRASPKVKRGKNMRVKTPKVGIKASRGERSSFCFTSWKSSSDCASVTSELLVAHRGSLSPSGWSSNVVVNPLLLQEPELLRKLRLRCVPHNRLVQRNKACRYKTTSCPFSIVAVPSPVLDQGSIWSQFVLFRQTKN